MRQGELVFQQEPEITYTKYGQVLGRERKEVEELSAIELAEWVNKVKAAYDFGALEMTMMRMGMY